MEISVKSLIHLNFWPFAPQLIFPKQFWHIFRMGKTVYRIILQPNSTFTAEIFEPGGRHYGASGFTSEAEAEAWINEKKKIAKVDEEWERIAFDVSPINGRQKT